MSRIILAEFAVWSSRSGCRDDDPSSFPDKRAALLGAFIARFGLGFVICNVNLAGWDCRIAPRNPAEVCPTPSLRKAMVPILVSGVIGGLIIGAIASKFGS